MPKKHASARLPQVNTTDRYPDHLWPTVEEFLMAHLHTKSGFALGRVKSASEAVRERASAGSIKTKRCRSCSGRGFHRRGLVHDFCRACAGSGVILSTGPKPVGATATCGVCNGGGVHHPRSRRWRGIRADELARCVACRGDGYYFQDAGPSLQASQGGPSAEQSPRNWVQPVLDHLDAMDSRSSLVLDMVYGSVGHALTRVEGVDRSVALWSLTTFGQRLVKLSTDKHRNLSVTILREIRDQQCNPNDFRGALIREAEDAALLLLARARKSLWKADQLAEARLYRAARRLHLKGKVQR